MFMLVEAPSQHNMILGRPSLSAYATIIALVHLMMISPVEDLKDRVIGFRVVHEDQHVSRRCYVAVVRSSKNHKW